MEDMSDAENYLTRIIIDSAYIEDIAEELYFIGWNELSLYPELESISKEIIRKNK